MRDPAVIMQTILLLFFYDLPTVLINAVFRNNPANTGSRIDIAVSADDCARIADRVASYFDMVSQHCAELLDAGLDVFITVMYYNEMLVRLDIGCDRSSSHMAVISEDRISDIVIVRCLDMVEEYDVLELDGIAHYTVSAYQSRTPDKSAVSDFSIRPDDTRCTEICCRKDLGCFMHPHILAYFLIFLRIQCRTELKDKIFDPFQCLPGIGELPKIFLGKSVIKVV